VDPPLLALVLGLFSAVTLAGANTFVKASKDILAGRSVMTLTTAVLALPFAFIMPLPNAATWAVLALSIPAHWIYQTTLVRALSRGDLSLVFPVMRGSAPLLTALFAGLFLHEHLSNLSLLGLFIASLATLIFALPERNFGGSHTMRNTALMWACLTGAMVAVYNVVDAKGTRTAPNPFSFTVWLFLLDWIGVNTVTFLTRGAKAYGAMLRSTARTGIGAGTLSLFSFSAALYGFSIAPVAYISAMRETAVVFAALMGWFFLREGFGARRTLAAVILAGGLSLMQFG